MSTFNHVGKDSFYWKQMRSMASANRFFFLSYLHFDPAEQKHSKYNNLLEENWEE